MAVNEPNYIQERAFSCFQETTKDMIVVSQTGSGKTLTFLMPILQSLRASPEAQAIVIAPSDLLLHQHREAAFGLDPVASKRISFVTQYDGQTGNQDSTARTPNNICVVAVDEVDKVFFQASAFDEETTLTATGEAILRDFLTTTKYVRLICTTAFLSRAHQNDLVEKHMMGAELIREHVKSAQTQVLVPTLRQKFKYFSGDRIEKLLQVLVEAQDDEFLSQGSTMIFCGGAQHAREAFDRFKESDDKDNHQPYHHVEEDILLLHEELQEKETLELLTKLSGGGGANPHTNSIVFCTDVAARGLHIPNVRHVILLTVPTTISSFVHQVGRTARRGESGIVTCLVSTASGDYQKYTNLHALQGASTLEFK